ncbi:uncharacterized protein LOC101859900 [Aplysia californica]|uniref:Uncharacterized protein LOC101859900 n=1 Tax=Aplysia californica TaxID=6500 RepID=A0ABM1VUX0_APLCA|nr:uncharacterized protein LOC101859900 [Aplysia californica]
MQWEEGWWGDRGPPVAPKTDQSADSVLQNGTKPLTNGVSLGNGHSEHAVPEVLYALKHSQKSSLAPAAVENGFTPVDQEAADVAHQKLSNGSAKVSKETNSSDDASGSFEFDWEDEKLSKPKIKSAFTKFQQQKALLTKGESHSDAMQSVLLSEDGLVPEPRAKSKLRLPSKRFANVDHIPKSKSSNELDNLKQQSFQNGRGHVRLKNDVDAQGTESQQQQQQQQGQQEEQQQLKQQQQQQQQPKKPWLKQQNGQAKSNSQYSAVQNGGHSISGFQSQGYGDQSGIAEYEKSSMGAQAGFMGVESLPYQKYQYKRYSTDTDDSSAEEDSEDKMNAMLCVVCCLFSVCILIGVVVLLCHYAEKKAEEQRIPNSDRDCLDVANSIYHRKIADIIQGMSRDHNHLLRDLNMTSLAVSRPEDRRDDVSRAFQTFLAVQQQELRQKQSIPKCPSGPPELVGSISGVNLSLELDINEVMRGHSDVMEGGEWRPSTCISRHRVAIIVPYRDRWSHLKVLLYYLIPILKRQQIHFRIFVVEQFGNDTFNKGRIMNAAFREAVKLFDFQCVTFHDVDLVPEDDRNMYSCTEQPKHMSIAIDKFSYVLPYQGLVGGVLSFRNSHFQLVNGYSNMYWGWGAEDDDMTTRILHRGLRIYRPPSNIARYKMVKHDQRKISEMTVRMKLLRSAARRSKLEGLNNVMYKVLFTHKEKLFTHFMVDIGKP